MKFKSVMTAICVLATANLAVAAPFAYVANSGTKNVSVIDTADNTIKATAALLGTNPYAYGVTVGASGQFVYVGLQTTNEVQIIDTLTNSVIKRIYLGADVPGGLAVNAAETRLYVTSNMSNTLIIIDISGAASEVGRVNVETAPISNPSGVVLSPAGDKAYVANTGTGTIAEIALDEPGNVYTRASLTPVSAAPIGLAITSTGTPPNNTYKLYVSSGLGSIAGVLDTDSKVFTPLTVGQGTMSLAITPDNSKVYAPSNDVNGLYVIDGAANTVLGTQYSILAGAQGSAVTPDGLKLFIANELNNSVQVFSTVSNSVTATINLIPTAGAGAKPISLGNFIGPVFPYTITATNGAGCTISPLGAIPVNYYGRKFTISPPDGTCEVKVDGVSVGNHNSYVLSDIVANGRTIDASQGAAGTYYTIAASWYNPAGGFLVSTPAGINENSRSALFISGSTVTIKANTGYKAIDWTGACAGQGSTCTIAALAADKIVSATIIVDSNPGGPIFNATKSVYYQTLGEAVAAASTGDVIKIAATYNTGGTTSGSAANVLLSCGWSPDYTSQSTSTMGTLTIGSTGVVIDPASAYALII